MALNEQLDKARGLVGPYTVAAQRLAREYRDRGVGRTLLWRGEPIASAGLHLAWPGLAFGWAVIPELARRRPHIKLVNDAIETALASFVVDHTIRRVEVNVDASFIIGQRWVERLGFVWESDMPCFGPDGQDFKKYVIVRR